MKKIKKIPLFILSLTAQQVLSTESPRIVRQAVSVDPLESSPLAQSIAINNPENNLTTSQIRLADYSSDDEDSDNYKALINNRPSKTIDFLKVAAPDSLSRKLARGDSATRKSIGKTAQLLVGAYDALPRSKEYLKTSNKDAINKAKLDLKEKIAELLGSFEEAKIAFDKDRVKNNKNSKTPQANKEFSFFYNDLVGTNNPLKDICTGLFNSLVHSVPGNALTYSKIHQKSKFDEFEKTMLKAVELCFASDDNPSSMLDFKTNINKMRTEIPTIVEKIIFSAEAALLDQWAKEINTGSFKFLGSTTRDDTSDILSTIFLHNEEQNSVEVLCLGTHVLSDWTKNLNALTARGGIANTDFLEPEDKVHTGFGAVAQQTFNYMKGKLKTGNELSRLLKDSNVKINVSGHSLGGAFGELLAYGLTRGGGFQDRVSLVTYCQPPTCKDRDTAKRIDKALKGNNISLYNNRDVIAWGAKAGLATGFVANGGLRIALKSIDKMDTANQVNVLSAHAMESNWHRTESSLKYFSNKYGEEMEAIENLQKIKANRESRQDNPIQTTTSENGDNYKIVEDTNSASGSTRETIKISANTIFNDLIEKVGVYKNNSANWKQGIPLTNSLTNFATAILGHKDDITPKDYDTGTFVIKTLQMLNSITPKNNKTAASQIYQANRAKIIDALSANIENRNLYNSVDMLDSLTKLYTKNLDKGIAFDIKKSAKDIIKTLALYPIHIKKLENIKLKLEEEQTKLKSALIGTAKLSDKQNAIKQSLDQVTEKIMTIDNSTESFREKLYNAYNAAFANFSKNEKSTNRILTLAKQLTENGFFLDHYHSRDTITTAKNATIGRIASYFAPVLKSYVKTNEYHLEDVNTWDKALVSFGRIMKFYKYDPTEIDEITGMMSPKNTAVDNFENTAVDNFDGISDISIDDIEDRSNEEESKDDRQ